MPENSVQASPGSEYQGAIDRVRAAAQWLIGAFAAVGAVLIAGLQLTGLGELNDADLAAAIFGVLVAAFGVGLAIFYAAKVLTPEQTTIRGLATDPVNEILRGDLMLGNLVREPGELEQKLREARQAFDDAWAVPGAGTEGNAAHQRAMTRTQELTELHQVARLVQSYANWAQLNRLWSRAQVATGAGALLALAGILVFAYFGSKEAPFSPGEADARVGRLVELSFDGDRQKAMQRLLGNTCDLTAVRAILINSDEESSEFEVVSIPEEGRCSANHFKLEAGQGVVVNPAAPELPTN